MAGAGKTRHIDADFGDQHARRRLAHAGHRRQKDDGGLKGTEDVPQVALQLRHRRLERLDLGQVQTNQKAMVGRDPTV